MKRANVIPLYKAQYPVLLNNYSSISLLSIFSKIIERLMCDRLIELLNKNNSFNKYQFGIQNSHSTVMALIVQFENLTPVLNKEDHEWFINYLSNRTQSVNYHECVSDSRTQKIGVPQGSILGPLLVLV